LYTAVICLLISCVYDSDLIILTAKCYGWHR